MPRSEDKITRFSKPGCTLEPLFSGIFLFFDIKIIVYSTPKAQILPPHPAEPRCFQSPTGHTNHFPNCHHSPKLLSTGINSILVAFVHILKFP